MTRDLGTLSTAGDRMMLRYERRFAHSPGRVWRMITDPAGLARWFPAAVAYESLTPGAPMTFTFGAADLERAAAEGVEGVPQVSGGFIREVVAERVFAFDWLNEPIRFELTPDGDGCRLVFTHVFDRDEAQAPLNAAGWHVCLDALAAALDGRDPPSDRGAELRGEYRRALGIAASP